MDNETIDHNLCLSNENQSIRKVGRLRSKLSGLQMDIRTTEPGL